LTTYDPPRRLVLLRLLARPYRYGGIRLQRRAILLVYIAASSVWAVAGPQFVRLFAPALTGTDVLILTCLGATIYLIDDLVTFAAITPRLRKLQRWFDEPGTAEAADIWRTAAEIPLAPMLRPASLLFLAGLNILWIVVLIHLLHLPPITFLLFLPGAMLFRFYWFALRSLVTEQMMRPVLADISRHVTEFGERVRVRVGLPYRLLGTIPLIAVLAGTIVAGIVGPHTIHTLSIGVGLSLAISVTIASPLLLLVTRSVTEPLRDLRLAADRVGDGDFTVIGDPVNVAARVESATRQTGDTILLSQHTWDLLSPTARAATVPRPAVPLKGKTQTVSLYAPG
jgi:adenylate cyclase